MKEYIVQAIAQETIDTFDAHNAPELIRCKDCKHWCKPLIQCSKFTVNGVAHCTSPEWFCADGVKKDD